MKKYTPVFGDQSLFDGALPNVAVMCSDETWHRDLNAIPKLITQGKIPVAARLIEVTPEPKRWTVEDQKAGRLPEVGWVVRATGVNEDARIAAINNDAVCVVFEDGGFITLHVSGITPIETPAEKAQREEDEFVDALVSEYNKMPSSISFKAGIRAAYRKMKGGE